MPYKYHLGPDQVDGEAGKAKLDNIMRPERPDNYAEELIKRRDSDKIILIPPVVSVLRLLDAENIPYILVYPQRNSRMHTASGIRTEGMRRFFRNLY